MKDVIVVKAVFPGIPIVECMLEGSWEKASAIDNRAMEILDELEIEDPTTEEAKDVYDMAAEEKSVIVFYEEV